MAAAARVEPRIMLAKEFVAWVEERRGITHGDDPMGERGAPTFYRWPRKNVLAPAENRRSEGVERWPPTDRPHQIAPLACTTPQNASGVLFIIEPTN